MTPARQAALELMTELENKGRIDFESPDQKADPRFSTEYLWGSARGKMFGVMVATAKNGSTVHMRAFSGQYNGVWRVPGWAEPAFDLKSFHKIHDAEEKKIKALGRRIDQLESDSVQRRELTIRRKKKSQQLMRALHGLYRLQNFSGQTSGLEEIFQPGIGIPTGTGDCCAPKLLQHAADHGLLPLGIAEFYWGEENASRSRRHGEFYPSCRTKCYPILGFMLCGLCLG